jgi:2-polyprenyl-6-methoxyphenol hydroxylase-like FAD-dependent oxidoreductase
VHQSWRIAGLSGLPGIVLGLKYLHPGTTAEAVMKIAIIGGGPAGLYSAILLKKQRPQAEITVYERNRPDDTFGFGVVFSDATLDNFEKYDLPSYQRITQEFATGMISPCTFAARSTASAATASAAVRAARC